MSETYTPELGEVNIPMAKPNNVDYEKAAVSAMSAVISVIEKELSTLPPGPNDDTAIVRNIFTYTLNQLKYNLEIIKTN